MNRLESFNEKLADIDIEWSKVSHEIILIQFANPQEQASVMLRFQEYYESPKYHKTFFTLEEYKEYYIDKYGKFSYATDWTGFNIPHWAVEPFRKHDLPDFTDREQALIDFLDKHKYTPPYYIISTLQKETNEALKHELAHAYYTTMPQYKNKVDEILLTIPQYLFSKIFKRLEKTEYHPNVIHDEIQACLIDGYSLQEFMDIKILKLEEQEILSQISDELIRVFGYYTKHNH